VKLLDVETAADNFHSEHQNMRNRIMNTVRFEQCLSEKSQFLSVCPSY